MLTEFNLAACGGVKGRRNVWSYMQRAITGPARGTTHQDGGRSAERGPGVHHTTRSVSRADRQQSYEIKKVDDNNKTSNVEIGWKYHWSKRE